MNQRPKLRLTLSKADKIIEILGWVLLTTHWILTAVNYQNLPEVIPTHYNASGVADGFGDKWLILTLPLVATVLLVAMTIVNRFPHLFNYPATITKDNALSQYTHATRLIRLLKVVVTVIFNLLTYQTIRHANQQSQGLETWFLPFVLGLVFIPLAYFAVKSSKTPNKVS